MRRRLSFRLDGTCLSQANLVSHRKQRNVIATSDNSYDDFNISRTTYCININFSAAQENIRVKKRERAVLQSDDKNETAI